MKNVMLWSNSTCFWCGGTQSVYVKKIGSHDTYYVNEQPHTIALRNYPVIQCASCGKETYDVKKEETIDEIIDYKVHQSLKQNKKMPEVIDFDCVL